MRTGLSILGLASLALLPCPSLSAAPGGPAEQFGRLPLSFEANRGQSCCTPEFLARGRGYRVSLTGSEAVLALTRSRRSPAADPETFRADERTLLRMTLAGANPRPQGAGLEELPGRVNYFVGNDPAKWRTNIPTYAKVRYKSVYPGVDLVYYGNERQLEYDFVVAPGADPRVITLGFEGAQGRRIDAQGDLVLSTGGGELRLRKPFVYQDVDGVRKEVRGRYVLQGKRQVRFQVAAYDRTKALVIDPVLVYSTYLGGSGEDNGSGIVVDATGIYVAGLTASGDFPTGGTPYQGAIAADYDAYVTKLNPAGTALIYSTYLGGNSTDYGLAVAVDGSGNAYVTGLTASTDFPTAGTPYQGSNGGDLDGYLAKLNSTGSSLIYSTYLGGTSADFGLAVAVDASGNAYVAGRTDSTDFPTAGTPFQSSNGGAPDAFVAKLNPSLTGTASLAYSTYLGGSGEERANGIVVDGSGNATVTGRTISTDFPTAGPPYQSTPGGNYDAYVTRLNSTGSSLLYSTYLGGSGDDRGFSIAKDSSGNVYITGRTLSTDFPTTVGAFDAVCGSDGNCNFGFMDAYAAKLDPALSGAASLVYSTYLGGSRDEEGEGIAVDGSGNAYVTGYTDSTDFPTANAFQPVCGMGCGIGFVDVFVTKLNPAGSALVFSSYLGGSSSDYGISIAVDGSSVYLTGETFSDNFPTVSPYSGTWSGNYDVLIAKIDGAATTSADLGVSKAASPDPAVVGMPLTYTITVTNNGPDTATGVRLSDQMLASGVNVASATPSQGSCTVVSFTFHELRCDFGSLASSASATVTFVVTPTSAGTLSNTARVASNVSDSDGANNTATHDVEAIAVSAPTITSFTPANGIAGVNVTINGTNLANATSVTFNGTPATVTSNTATQIKANVPADASTGKIAVTTAGGTATSMGTFTVKPNITGFAPTFGAVGVSVTINGTGFGGATSVKFNGTTASLPAHSNTQIVTSVPANATTGKITVTTPAGTASSAGNFTVAPRITSFSPASGAIGATVTINGANLTGATSVTFNGTSATITTNSATQVKATVPPGGTSGLIAVTTAAGTAQSATSFTVNPTPTITNFTPGSGAVGVNVTINGTNFTGVTSVKFNGTSATITSKTDVQIKANVPANATTGPITVTTPGGTATSATSFTVAPRITSISPASGVIGASVVVNGANFTGATSVTFNGTSASFTVNSAIKITATAPAGATTGKIAVTTPAGTALSAANFTVKPNISGFTPSSGAVGDPVTINGTGFTGATAVKFNGTATAIPAHSSTQIVVNVPANATTGKITVTTPGGTATSVNTFTVAPRITTFTPTSGAIGINVTINGANFTGATAVKFNGTSATTYTVNTSVKITANVPVGATTGAISVTTPAGTGTSAATFTVLP